MNSLTVRLIRMLLPSPGQLLNYWSDVLRTEYFRSPDTHDAQEVPREAFDEGRVPTNVIKNLKSRLVESSEEGNVEGVHRRLPSGSMEVLIAHRLYQEADTDKHDQWPLIWVPASLDCTSGTLAPITEGPWMARDCLDPTITQGPIVGTLDQWFQFVNNHAYTANNWEDVKKHVYCVLQEFDLTQETPTLEGFIEQEKTVVLLFRRNVSAQLLLPVYDTLNDEGIPDLLRRFTREGQPESLPQDLQRAVTHFGHMSAKTSLTPEQRTVVEQLLRLSEGELLAVNGPPGTGKTNLIQNAIAAFVVRRAIDREDPPIIVVTSTNNKAITSVLDGFEALADDAPTADQIHLNRWLPELSGYGSYATARHLESSARKDGYQIFSDIQARAESRRFIKQAEQFWLSQYQKWAGRPANDISAGIDHLHARLREVAASIEASLREAYDVALAIQDGTVERAHVELFSARQEVLCFRAEADERKVALAHNAGENSRRLASYEKRYANYLDRFGKPTFAESLLACWKPIKKQIAMRARNAALLAGIPLPSGSDKLAADVISTIALRDLKTGRRHFRLEEARIQRDHDAINHRLDELLEAESSAKGACVSLERRREIALNLLSDLAGPDRASALLGRPSEILELLDRGPRREAFALAMRYFEGRWASERVQALNKHNSETIKFSQGSSGLPAKWRSMAALTPCSAMTIYQVSKLFTAYDFVQTSNAKKKEYRKRALLKAIDLLIIDEAGQVAPELGAPIFGLAKRALVIGDTEQLTPVPMRTRPVDAEQAIRVGLNEGSYNKLDSVGGASATGNLMRLAQRATAYSDPEAGARRGFLLRRHWRCVPEIIDFCNKFVYNERLIPCRASIGDADRVLLPWQYAHVGTLAQRHGSSWVNRGEARAIAHWLRSHRDQIQSKYALSLGVAVGVITPYAAQKWALIQEIKKVFGRSLPRDLTIGTIASLQGAEKPIIIFSPTVSSEPRIGRPLFDQSMRILNVAVSRAKDSFVVIGDMNAFRDDGSDWPSSRLAKFLYAREDNRLIDIEVGLSFDLTANDDVVRLATTAEHQSELAQSLARARQRVVIVSPQISINAIRADQIEWKLHTAIERNVKVTVYTDNVLDNNDGQLSRWARDGRDALVRAGVELIVVDRLHSKTLIVDKETIVEGSFNWLAAARDSQSKFHRLNSSLRYQGDLVEQFATRAERVLEGLRGIPWNPERRTSDRSPNA